MGSLVELLKGTKDGHERIREVLTVKDLTSLISSQKEQARDTV